jgi:hypothetical protein
VIEGIAAGIARDVKEVGTVNTDIAKEAETEAPREAAREGRGMFLNFYVALVNFCRSHERRERSSSRDRADVKRERSRSRDRERGDGTVKEEAQELDFTVKEEPTQ